MKWCRGLNQPPKAPTPDAPEPLDMPDTARGMGRWHWVTDLEMEIVLDFQHGPGHRAPL